MQRRAFLATAGAMMTAGCGSLLGGSGGSGDGGDDQGLNPGYSKGDGGINYEGSAETIDLGDGGGVSNVSSVDSNTSTIELNNNQNASTIELSGGADDTIGLGSSGGGTATRENKEATKHITKAKQSLRKAQTKYTKQAGRRATILDVGATVDSFKSTPLPKHIDAALNQLDKAAGPATEGQQLNIAALREVALFLYESAKVDQRLAELYDELTYAIERIYSESLSQAGRAEFRMESTVDEAQKLYEPIDRDISQESMKAYEHLSQRTYERKLRRMDRQIAGFEDFRSIITTVVSGIKDAGEGIPKYISREYEEARSDLLSANSSFASAMSTFNLSVNAGYFGEKVAEFRQAVKTMELATNSLHKSADARVEDEPQVIFYESRRAAKEQIEANDIVSDMETFRDLIY